MFAIPPRQRGVRNFDNGLHIKTSTKLLIDDTGGDVWRGAIALTKYFQMDQPDLLRGKSVLELASGTGLLGLSLSLPPISASSVVLTDKENMVELVAANILHNASILPADGVHCTTLDWTSINLDPLIVSKAPFDVIVMSDVFYDEEIIEPLLQTLRRLCLLSCSGEVYPAIYMCASHRTDRIEGMFFAAARDFFDFVDVTCTSCMRAQLHRDFIAIWTVHVRAHVTPAQLASGLPTGVGSEEMRAAALAPCPPAESHGEPPHDETQNGANCRWETGSNVGIAGEGIPRGEEDALEQPSARELRDRDGRFKSRDGMMGGVREGAGHGMVMDLEELD